MAISVGTTTITFSDSSTQSTAATSYSSPSPNIQTFNSTGTWTKPTGDYRMARIQLWGGGAGGAMPAGAGNSSSGGGGGAYNEVTVPFSYIATQTVTVGGGGAAGGSTGAAGGTSSVTVTASSASNGRATISAPGAPANGGTYYGSGASLVVSDTGYYWNGGYGGFSWAADTNGTAMGSTWGGGGGGAYNATSPGAPNIAGGTSYYGGSGGAYNSAGTVPGGGGGCYTATAYAGASGRVVITCY